MLLIVSSDAQKFGRTMRTIMLQIRSLNTDEAAACLSLSRARLAKLRWAGGGPKFVRVGKTVLYRVTDLEKWLDANSRNNTSSLQPVATNST
jgi:hypothetical protein